MALAHVANDGSTSGQAKPTLTIAFPSNVVAGNLLLLGIGQPGVGGTSTVNTISDTRGNTWQVDKSQATANNLTARVYSCISVGSGANTVSITMSATTDLDLYVMEFSGVTSTSWLDATEGDTATSTALDSGAGQSIAQADEVLIGLGLALTSTFTAGSGYTLSTATARPSTMLEWQIVAATGTYDATMTIGAPVGWAMILTTYKAPAVAGFLLVHN